MTKFNFDECIERRNSGSYKWDAAHAKGKLPMWVADMDFKTAPCVIKALHDRVEHGIFGYAQVPQSYYEAVLNWFAERHQFTLQQDWLLYTSGVVPAISAILKALINPGDRVILQTPGYNCFFSSIRNMQGELVENALLCRDGYYTMDFDDLEQKAADPKAKVLLLCNPHNPVGRAWSKEELRQLGEICFRHNIVVISDEIHCDLTYPGVQHQPFAAMGEEFLQHSITTIAASKSFNLAGLQLANIVAEDPTLRAKIDKALNIHEVCDVSPIGLTATTAAYEEGGPWLDALRAYIFANVEYARGFFSDYLPAISVTKQEATYLMWLNITATGYSSTEFVTLLEEQENLLINAGTVYGADGEGYVRLNVACPRKTLEEGLNRIRQFLK